MAVSGIIKKAYREDYLGEFIIKKVIIKNGKKHLEKEWINNPITIKHLSYRAVCLAEDGFITDLFYKQIENHNGGNLGKMKMHMYGVDSVWKKLTPNFCVTKDKNILEDMIKEKFTEKSIVYTSSKNCLKYPEEFYLIPHNISSTTHAIAVWLACFDGHKEVYLVGYDHTNPKIINSVLDVMKTYEEDVKFYHVTSNHSPHEWLEQLNFTSINKQTFVATADI